MIIDSISGAVGEYPKFVTPLLVPSEFSSVQERDAYFERKKAEIESGAARDIEAARKRCEDASPCDAIAAIEKRRSQHLASLGAQRGAVRIKP